MVQHPDEELLELVPWMGVWAPYVHHFSSNWKELHTLLWTMEKEHKQVHEGRRLGSALFYFTDKLVTYYIVQSGSSSSLELHKLIREIKRL
jgi:hypothetical protein